MNNLARIIEFPSIGAPPSASNRPFHSEGEGRKWRYADYKKWDDDIRREVIGGRVYMMAAPTTAHQGISMSLSRQFANYLVGKPCRVYAAPFDVRLFAPCYGEDDESDHDIVQPDISIICDKAKRHKEGCRGAPDLVVEILSASNRSHDTLLKFNKYLEAGVREYWVIDPDDKVLQAHTLIQDGGGNRYATAVYGADEKVKAGIFDDCYISLDEVFAAAEETE
jgi:Uma2 family endonuclease